MRTAVTILGLLLWSAGAQALTLAPEEPRPTLEVLHHEVLSTLQAAPAAAGDDRLTLSFDALGRRFELQLEPNEQLARHLRGADSAVYRGTLRGRADSWVRLTRRGDRYSGLISDGGELLVIDSGRALGLTGSETPVLFRLADTLLDSQGMSCSAHAHPSRRLSGAMTMNALGAELSQLMSQHGAGNGGATHTITLSVVGDHEFVAHHGDEASDAIVERVNIVDGLYREQLGLNIELTMIDLLDHDPFDTNDSGDLLNRFSQYRRDSGLSGTGLSHLFTGRRLTDSDGAGNVVGTAYLDSPCHERWASAVSRAVGANPLIDSLVIAHEIGHNFGAPHDGENEEPGDVCGHEPEIYLMAPRLQQAHRETWDQFSACSVEVMTPVILGATCVATVAAEPPAPPPVQDGTTDSASGGGGSAGLWWLALAALAMLGSRARRPPTLWQNDRVERIGEPRATIAPAAAGRARHCPVLGLRMGRGHGSDVPGAAPAGRHLARGFDGGVPRRR